MRLPAQSGVHSTARAARIISGRISFAAMNHSSTSLNTSSDEQRQQTG